LDIARNSSVSFLKRVKHACQQHPRFRSTNIPVKEELFSHIEMLLQEFKNDLGDSSVGNAVYMQYALAAGEALKILFGEEVSNA
jgi:hypothetical protein